MIGRKRTKPRRKPTVDQPSPWPARAALAATVFSIVVSVAVAVPSQLQYFLDARAVTSWTDPHAWYAVAQTLLLESLCWLCALLYAASLANTPVRLYRLGTFVFAGIAAGINYSHGTASGGVTIGVLNALGSLMGVGAWELYMHRARHRVSGMSIAEIRLRALRWRKHPRVMREAARITATFGLAVPLEVAFRMAYLRKIGNPTLPVAITSPRLADRPGEPSPEPSKRKPGDAEQTVELPVDWSCPADLGELIAEVWPAPGPELGGTSSGTAVATPDRPTSRPKPAPRSVPQGSTPGPSTRSASDANSGNTGSGGRRNSLANLTGRSARLQFTPTEAERSGAGDPKPRIVAYLARAEAKGQPIDQLDRKYIADQFGVSTRTVRNALTAHSAAKAEGRVGGTDPR
jgi:hypothetical protein